MWLDDFLAEQRGRGVFHFAVSLLFWPPSTALSNCTWGSLRVREKVGSCPLDLRGEDVSEVEWH